MEISTRIIGKTICKVTVKSSFTTITEDLSGSSLRVDQSEIEEFFNVGIDLSRFNRKSDLETVKDFILFIDLSESERQELIDELS